MHLHSWHCCWWWRCNWHYCFCCWWRCRRHCYFWCWRWPCASKKKAVSNTCIVNKQTTNSMWTSTPQTVCKNDTASAPMGMYWASKWCLLASAMRGMSNWENALPTVPNVSKDDVQVSEALCVVLLEPLLGSVDSSIWKFLTLTDPRWISRWHLTVVQSVSLVHAGVAIQAMRKNPTIWKWDFLKLYSKCEGAKRERERGTINKMKHPHCTAQPTIRSHVSSSGYQTSLHGESTDNW